MTEQGNNKLDDKEYKIFDCKLKGKEFTIILYTTNKAYLTYALKLLEMQIENEIIVDQLKQVKKVNIEVPNFKPEVVDRLRKGGY